MPVFFYVDPEFATDPRMRKVNHLTLSYTFFKVQLGSSAVPLSNPASINTVPHHISYANILAARFCVEMRAVCTHQPHACLPGLMASFVHRLEPANT